MVEITLGALLGSLLLPLPQLLGSGILVGGLVAVAPDLFDVGEAFEAFTQQGDLPLARVSFPSSSFDLFPQRLIRFRRRVEPLHRTGQAAFPAVSLRLGGLLARGDRIHPPFE